MQYKDSENFVSKDSAFNVFSDKIPDKKSFNYTGNIKEKKINFDDYQEAVTSSANKKEEEEDEEEFAISLDEIIEVIAPNLYLYDFIKLIDLLKSSFQVGNFAKYKNKLFNELIKYMPEIIANDLIKLLIKIRLNGNIKQSNIDHIFNYLIKRYKPKTKIDLDVSKRIGYKTKIKVNDLGKKLPDYIFKKDFCTTSFPLKMNSKFYQLHRTAARYSYIIDLMIENKLVYLIAININTRYLYAELMNKTINTAKNSYSKTDVKSSKSFIKALKKLYNKGIIIRHLCGDSEKCFWSCESQAFYDRKGIIDFFPVDRQKKVQYPRFMKSKQHLNTKTEPLHTGLGIIDRVIRTLRDMAFHMEVDIITPDIMDSLVNQYNNAIHNTLSKYAGFPVTPKQVQNDIELEDYIVRNVARENYLTRERIGYYLKKGTKVKVYNEKDSMNKRRSIIQPGDFEVVAFTDGLCIVKNIVNDELQTVPRWKITPY